MNRNQRFLMRLCSNLLIFLLLHHSGFSQNYRFRLFGVDKGLCDNTVYTIAQSDNGYIWLGTGLGLCRYDGFEFNGNFTKDSLPKAPVRISYKDEHGNLWFGLDDGTILVYKGKSFKTIKSLKSFTSKINAFFEDKNGNVFCVSQGNGIARINSSLEVKLIGNPIEGALLSSASISPRDEILLGTMNGLYLCRFTEGKGSIEEVSKVQSIPSNNIQCIFKVLDKDQYYIGTDDEGLFSLSGSGLSESNYSASSIIPRNELKNANVQSVYQDYHGNLWVSTKGRGLFELIPVASGSGFKEILQFSETSGLGDKYINNVFQDREGIIWVATYNKGLASLSAGGFLFYDFQDAQAGKNFSALFAGQEYLWIGTEKGLLRVKQNNPAEKLYIGPKNGLPNDIINALYQDESTLWIGTSRNGIYRMPVHSVNASRFYYSVNLLENDINYISGTGNILYSATNNGVIRFDLKKGERRIFNMNTGLTYNRVLNLLIDKNDSVWVATKGNGIYTLYGHYKLLKSKAEIEFTCLAVDKNGYLWAGTNGNGAIKFQDTSVYVYTDKNGLRSNYCYSMIAGQDGNIWVGHRLGLSRINPESNIIVQYGPEFGITGDFNPNASTNDKNGKLYFGTTDGLIGFDYSREITQKVPPLLNLISLKVNDVDVDFSKPIVLPFNRYKLRIDFIGLHFKSPERVNYQYRLEGYDADWMEPTTAKYVLYSNVSDGQYTFKLKACSGEGYCGDQPLELAIRVSPPFWKTWWFILSAIAALVLTVIGIIKYNEQRHIEFERKLQKELDERTREVMLQKEEIEIKNRDITDSINYAQRIQASILPSMKRLQEKFSGSFIFYQPRDIVSGDFYWFDMVGPDKFMIVCADSTGHGVPGAFMSMIGTTLIKDICIRNESYSPADILCMLDSEIRSTLNQNIEAERSNDGMDIIVCEIDIKTYKVRLSSAMRPMIVYRNGEQIYIPGSKSSVGGVYEEKELKIFEENTHLLSKGDLIYMFSDGYPDQFGGPLGKKFKMVRLRNLLQHIYTKPMDEQYQHVMNNFNLWRGNFEQVDDVLFLGIKI